MTDTTQLEDGFYWVRYCGQWIVAEKAYGAFWFAGDDYDYPESLFDEIDPRPIKREQK